MSKNRTVTTTHQGHRHGPITRVFSPSDLGQQLKPFIFLDYLDTPLQGDFGFGFHPHSGIATLTHQLDADVDYEDTSGQKGIVKAGGIEWMKAGSGVWHKGKPTGSEHAHGFQLWVALPAGIEDEPSEGQYLPPERIEHADNTRVLTGQYQTAQGHVNTPTDMNYFYIDLSTQAEWAFTTPAHHNVAWCYVQKGSVVVDGQTYFANTLLIFEEDTAHPIQLSSAPESTSAVLFGSAQRHAYNLVQGPYSVHTSAEALHKGEQQIQTIYQSLIKQNKI